MSNGDRASRLLLGSQYLKAPWGNPDFTPEHTPTYRIDQETAHARRLMGETAWARLMSEWDGEGVS